MASANLTAESPPSKRFHQPGWRGRAMLGILTFGVAAGKIFAGRGPYHVVEGMFWTCFGIIYLASGLTVWCELRPEGLFRRNLWATQLIPYTDITSVQQLEDMTRPIEVQYFSTSPNIFPRKKLIVGVSDRHNFVNALSRFTPHAEFQT